MVEKEADYHLESYESESDVKNDLHCDTKRTLKSSKKIEKKCKLKKDGGIKSRPIKYLKHPLERSIGIFFLVTLFFTLLAILTGVPVVAFLFILLLPTLFIKKLLSCQFGSLSPNQSPVTPTESYWLCKSIHADMFSLNTCLLFMDKGLSIDQLRDVIMARVIQRPEMAKFRSILNYKGLSQTPIWVKLSFDQFAIEKQIVNDHVITSKDDLKNHLTKIMPLKLPTSLPPWQIRWCFAAYLNQVILILRIHSSITDGISLAKILIQFLADQSPPRTATFIRTSQGIKTATYCYFKPHFGGLNFPINLCRAVVIGPLTFFLWLIWSISKRKDNVLKNFKNLKNSIKSTNKVLNFLKLTPKTKSCKNEFVPKRSIYWTSIELHRVYRVKQVTRCCLNDVLLAAITGSLRECLSNKHGITNPPNICLSMPVDIRGINDESDFGVKYVLLTSPLPTNTEGAIPRLWEIRRLMEEMKTSADSAVMFGVYYFLHSLLPMKFARYIIDLIHRNSSVCLSNLEGPNQEITIGTHRLRKLIYWMTPPSNIPVLFNVISYNNKIFVTVSTTSCLLPCAKSLAKSFKQQLDQLFDLLSKRRIPGDIRHKKKRTHLLVDAPLPIEGPTTQEITEKLNEIQLKLYHLKEMEFSLDQKSDQEDIEYKMEELKIEFVHLMKQLRRKKSNTLHNIIINIHDDTEDENSDSIDDDDDGIEGDIRESRRFSFGSRRASVVSALSIPSSRFAISSRHCSRTFINSPELRSSPERHIKEETV